MGRLDKILSFPGGQPFSKSFLLLQPSPCLMKRVLMSPMFASFFCMPIFWQRAAYFLFGFDILEDHLIIILSNFHMITILGI